MKKIYLSILSFVCVTSINAQVTLTKAANEPVLGDLEMFHYFDSTAVLNNSTGANQMWNFSALTTGTLTETKTYTTVASTPSAAAFSNATIANDDGQSGYTYAKSVGNQFELVGIVDPNITLNFTNTAVAAVWPISFGYTNSDTFSGSAASGTMTGAAGGSMTSNAVGNGTLTLPGGLMFNNVLQMKNMQTINLSLMMGIISATINTVEYSYYVPTQKFPVLSISYSSTSGSFTDYSVDIKINSNVVTGIKQLNNEVLVNLFPNPTKNNFNVNIINPLNENCTVHLFDIYGKQLKTESLGNNSSISKLIDVSDLAQGIYFVKTTLGNKTTTQKIIIE